ncbi:MAG: hypothetical protein OEZ48_13495 [Candidatus Bathyarchaeota archaeon]|nr:hypothetical protein [Candidatus Bathyarchaeota archaeon]MDH5688861.1 hypothetical protein [Candidatus Bathyarchaeota archaeon]
MREEEECEPGCYRHIYFPHICREKIILGSVDLHHSSRISVDHV